MKEKKFFKKYSPSKNVEKEEKNLISKDAVKKYVNPEKKSKKKIIIISTALALFLILIVWQVFSFFTKFKYEEIDENEIGINEVWNNAELNKIVNIALLGVDDNGTSDAILIVSINPKSETPKIKLISIARDTLVKVIPKNKPSFYTKINEAYGNGGEVTTLRTLNSNFNLNIRNFASINMKAFAKIIDKIGGIDIEITKDEQSQINGIIKTTKDLKKICSTPISNYGKVHLNGAQAVAFARIRKKPTKTGNHDDFGRGDRQREVLLKIFEKVKTIPKTRVLSLANSCLEYFKTSLKFKQIMKIFKNVLSKQYIMEQTSAPFKNVPFKNGCWISANKVTISYDLDYAGKVINEFIYKDTKPETFIENNPPPKNFKKLPIGGNFQKSDFSKNTENKNQKNYDNQKNYENKKNISNFENDAVSKILKQQIVSEKEKKLDGKKIEEKKVNEKHEIEKHDVDKKQEIKNSPEKNNNNKKPEKEKIKKNIVKNQLNKNLNKKSQPAKKK